MDTKLLDHSPNSEAVLLTFDGRNPIIVILTDFELHEFRDIYISCKLLVLSSHYSELSSHFTKHSSIKANFLISLVSYERMLSACINPPRNSAVVNSIIDGSLPQWGSNCNGERSFAVDAASLSMTINGELNQKQAETICEFAVAPPGLYLLQGPPGTGKTTTIIRLLKHMLEINPMQRIMICAPSNAAVHILAERAMEVLGRDVSMVFYGTRKDLSKDVRKALVEIQHHDLQIGSQNETVSRAIYSTVQSLIRVHESKDAKALTFPIKGPTYDQMIRLSSDGSSLDSAQ